MMKFLPAIVLLLSVFATNTIAQSGEEIERIVVDETFVDIGGRWGNGGRPISIFIKINGANGRYVVCAATTGIRTSDDRRVLQAHKVMLNGSVMLRSLRWAPNYSGDPVGQLARCRITDSAVVANPQFDVEMQRTRF